MEINKSVVDQDSTAYIGLQANRSTCKHFMKYTEPLKKRRNYNNSIRCGKQSIYFFSLNYRFLLQHKVLVLITKS